MSDFWRVHRARLKGVRAPQNSTHGWSDGFPTKRWVNWALWGEMSVGEFVNCELKTLILYHISSCFRVPWTARSSNQSILKEINPEYSLQDWCWTWNSNTLATLWEELTHWRRPWCQERLRAGEGGDRGWDGGMASLTQWTRVWANSGGEWRTGNPGMVQFMGSERLGHSLVTEQQWPTPALNVCSVWGAVFTLDTLTCDRCSAAVTELWAWLERQAIQIRSWQC